RSSAPGWEGAPSRRCSDAGCEGGPSLRFAGVAVRAAVSGAGAEFVPPRAGDGGTCAPAGGVTAERADGAAGAACGKPPCAGAGRCDAWAGGCAGAGRACAGFAAATGGVAVDAGGSPGRFGGASVGTCRAVGIGAFGLKVVVARWSDAGATRAGGRCVGRYALLMRVASATCSI